MGRYLKPYLLILFCLPLLVFSLSGCSKSVKSDSTNISINGCSQEALTVVNSLKPDDRINAVLEANEIITNLNYNNNKDFEKGINQLYTLADKYKLEDAVNKLDTILKKLKDPNRYGKIDLTDKSKVENQKLQLNYVFQQFFTLIINVYQDQHEFDYPLNVNIEKVNSAVIESGYSYKVKKDYKDIYYLPGNVSVDSKGQEKGNGINVFVDYDHHGNIMGIYDLPELIKYGMTESDFTSFLNESTENQRKITIGHSLINLKLLNTQGINNNQVLLALLNQTEIQQLDKFLKSLTTNNLYKENLKYYTDEDFAIRYSLLFTDKQIVLTLAPNNIRITHFIKKGSENSKYNKDLYALRYAFSTNVDENTNKNESIILNVDMSKFLTQTSEAKPANENTKSDTKINYQWYKQYNNFVREDGKYICSVGWFDDGTVSFEFNGLTVSMFIKYNDKFSPNNLLYEDIQKNGTYDFLYNYVNNELTVVDSVNDANDYSGKYKLPK